MHIPDGYLSPQTDAVLGLASALAAVGAIRKTNESLKTKLVPMLALGSAFSFTIMMFNIPVPDGTTAHATGGALLAILLGPWSAMISISVALAIQAFFFGDGGILALGANIFNLAVVLPFVSYGIYRLLTLNRHPSSSRRTIAAGIAGYIGINVSALLAGIEFGLQPVLFHTAAGVPLYSPYGLNIAVPAMAFAHLTIAGPVEALVTGLVTSYLLRSNPTLFQTPNQFSVPRDHHPQPLEQGQGLGQAQSPFLHSPDPAQAKSSKISRKKLAFGIMFLALLSPLGLLAKGTAWGEWGAEEIQSQIGYVPQGFAQFSEFWQHTLFKDYSLAGFGNSFWQESLGYLLSALVGLIMIGGIGLIVSRILSRSEERHEPTDLASRN